jgi:hypothetical protein
MRFPFPRMKTPDISKFSDVIPFSKDGNSRPFRNFPMRFPFPTMETPDHFEIFRWDYLFPGWKFLAISKFFDYILFSKDGNYKLVIDVIELWRKKRLYACLKWWLVYLLLLVYTTSGWTIAVGSSPFDKNAIFYN